MVEFIYKSLSRGHTEYRLQAKECKKKSHTLFKTSIKTIRKKKPAESKLVGVKCCDIHKEWYMGTNI